MAIQRWDFADTDWGLPPEMGKDDQGEWVRFDDHVKDQSKYVMFIDGELSPAGLVGLVTSLGIIITIGWIFT